MLKIFNGRNELNYENRNQGANAAANVDAANNAWLGAIGKGLESVGGVVKMFPGVGTAVGSAMQGVGGTLSGLADTSSTSLTNDQRQYIGNAWNAVQQSPAFQTGLNNLTGAIKNWKVNRKYGNVGDFNNSTGVFG